MHPSIYKYLTMYICIYIVYLYWEQITDAEQLWKKLVEIGMNNAPAGEKPEKRKGDSRQEEKRPEKCGNVPWLGWETKGGEVYGSVCSKKTFLVGPTRTLLPCDSVEAAQFNDTHLHIEMYNIQQINKAIYKIIKHKYTYTTTSIAWPN